MADARKLTTSDWLEMAAELAHHLEDEDESLAFYLTFLEATEETNRVALFDRNSLEPGSEWRKVVLELVERVEGYEESKWKLLDEDGVTILDEPDDGALHEQQVAATRGGDALFAEHTEHLHPMAPNNSSDLRSDAGATAT